MRLAVSLIVAFLLAAGFCPGWPHSARAEGPWRYVSPRPGARLVSPGTTIVLRNGAPIAPHSLSSGLFHVTGAASGAHEGQVVLADDGETVVFKPERPFGPAEEVRVSLDPGLATAAGEVLAGIDFAFTTWPAEPNAEGQAIEPFTARAADIAPARIHGSSSTPFLTVPADFPSIAVLTPASGTAEGYIFMNNIGFGQAYALMLDNRGEPVYYQRVGSSRMILDFTKQPNGQLTYYDTLYGRFFGLDSSYNIVSSYPAGNGYHADHHDLQILPNNHYQLLIWDGHTVDMSRVVPGGQREAWVIGLTVQELDSRQNVVFEWRSWDHIAYTESLENLTAKTITVVHGNAVEPDRDGNILISARNLDAILKINRQTGDLMWRLGGKKNDFTFANDERFHRPHDIRRLANGDITLFDNRTDILPLYSRAVEYRLDEVNKIATRVWQYRHTPDIYAPWVSNVQRLPNGNTLVSWGQQMPNVTEVTPDGTPVFELGFEGDLQASYRVFRFPWHGNPGWPPALVLDESNGRSVLHFSWNGATEVASYRILAGNTPRPQEVIATVAKLGFETAFDIAGVADRYCYFRVLPVDSVGNGKVYSHVVINHRAAGPCYNYYLPWIP